MLGACPAAGIRRITPAHLVHLDDATVTTEHRLGGFPILDHETQAKGHERYCKNTKDHYCLPHTFSMCHITRRFLTIRLLLCPPPASVHSQASDVNERQFL